MRVLDKKKLIVNSIVNDICSRISIGNLAAMYYSIKNDSDFPHFNEKTDEGIYLAEGSRTIKRAISGFLVLNLIFNLFIASS